MKKLKLTPQEFSTKQILTRAQLRNVLGGWDDGTTNDAWGCWSYCGISRPTGLPNSTGMEFQTGYCASSYEHGESACVCTGLPNYESSWSLQTCAPPCIGGTGAPCS